MTRTKISGPQKTVDVQRGLFVLHYTHAEDAERPPRVQVRTQSDDVEIISHPDSAASVLNAPGSSLVIRAKKSGQLLIEVMPQLARGSVAATLKLEGIPAHQDVASKRAGPSLSQPHHQALLNSTDRNLELVSLRVLGHVAGQGDIVVGSGEWIAGPHAPSRVEGLAIEWLERPPNVDLRYAVKVGGLQGRMGPIVANGQFAGTRGRARPVSGVLIELAGLEANRYRLTAEAMFNGGPVMREVGSRVQLSSRGGEEPLTGLRVSLAKQNVGTFEADQMLQIPTAPASRFQPGDPMTAGSRTSAVQPNAAPRSSAVRVFRSRVRDEPTER